jgi:hypothetical protein
MYRVGGTFVGNISAREVAAENKNPLCGYSYAWRVDFSAFAGLDAILDV